MEQNLVDIVWGTDIPKDPSQPVFMHPLELSGDFFMSFCLKCVLGETSESKLKRIREEMQKMKVSLLLVSKLEEIAWTLNLRGGDEPFTPIFISYLSIDQNSAELYIDLAKVPEDVKTYLNGLGVTVRPYSEILDGFKTTLKQKLGSKIWLDPSLINHAMFMAAKDVFGDAVRIRMFVLTKWNSMKLRWCVKRRL